MWEFFPVGSENSLGNWSVGCIWEYLDEAVTTFLTSRGLLDIVCVTRILQSFKCLTNCLIFHNFLVASLKNRVLLFFRLLFNNRWRLLFYALLFGWNLLNNLFRFLSSIIFFLYLLFQWFFVFIGLVGILFSASCDVDTTWWIII